MKKIATVVGLGISGYGAALLLSRKGFEVRVTEGFDTPQIRAKADALRAEKNISIEIGTHTREAVEGADVVVTSPGVKAGSKPLMWARELGIPVVDEIEMGYRFCPARIVAVTGTNGKSTTTTLIGEILKSAGYNAIVCGNIGYSFCQKVLVLKKTDVVVLEVSSFQLQRIDKFRPYVAVFLNITQNHLDRHKNFREYQDAKWNIFKNQKRSDWAVVNYEEKNLRGVLKRIKARKLYFGLSPKAPIAGASFKDGSVHVDAGDKKIISINSSDLALKGEHNLKNYMAAVLVGRIFKADACAVRDAVRTFKGLEHRFEFSGEIDGVTFINDSKATTVDAAVWAIRSAGRPVILIAGGRDKGSDFTVMRHVIENTVKAVILIGEAAAKIKTQILGTAPIYDAAGLDSAVFQGFELAKRGDCVLLSPMCASFDMFKSFEDRGEYFKRAVKALKERELLGAHGCRTR